MNLLIDMGNTRLKWGVMLDGRLIPGRALDNSSLNRHELVEAWKAHPIPKRLAIACVSATSLLELVVAVAVELWPNLEIIRVKSQAQAFGVCNAYQQPEKLGVDRWLAIVAARYYYRMPACIVDCGTAITVDLIDIKGHHQGGLISPGLTLMRKSLAEGTEALQVSETDYIFGLANSTGAAIYSGTLSAAVGLIEHVLAKQPDNVQLILTGGDAGLIGRHLKGKPVIDADLVLRGLAIVAQS
ncbi:MAG: type III pantothenate kinase [Methylococcales bacterium]|nr:type III pantothenate kinase [Methylococcales bacterium]